MASRCAPLNPPGNARAQELRRDDLGHEACHGLVTPEGGASRPLGCLGGRERFSWVCCERDGPFRCAGRLLAACEFDGIDREYRQQHLIDGRLASAVPHSPPRGTRDSCGEAPAAYERSGTSSGHMELMFTAAGDADGSTDPSYGSPENDGKDPCGDFGTGRSPTGWMTGEKGYKRA